MISIFASPFQYGVGRGVSVWGEGDGGILSAETNHQSVIFIFASPFQWRERKGGSIFFFRGGGGGGAGGT